MTYTFSRKVQAILIRNVAGLSSVDLILDAAESNAVLAAEFRGWFQPIPLDSEAADSLRKHHHLWEERKEQQDIHEAEAVSPIRIESRLRDSEAGDANAWWLLTRDMTEHAQRTYAEIIKSDLTKTTAWNRADEGTRRRIISAAKRFLEEFEGMQTEWFRTYQLHYPSMAGYRALRLLDRADPHALETLSEHVWAKWAPIIVGYPTWEETGRLDEHQRLVARAYVHDCESVITTLLALIDHENQQSCCRTSVLKKVAMCWDEQIASALLERVKLGTLNTAFTREILGELLDHGSLAAESYIASSLKVPLATSEEARLYARSAALALLGHGSNNPWPILGPILQDEDHFASNLISTIAETEREGAFLKRIEDDELGEFYAWLVVRYPPSEDPHIDGFHAITERESIGRFRDYTLSFLQNRGTRTAPTMIRQLAERLPHLPFLEESALAATAVTLRHSWVAPDPSQLLSQLASRTPNKMDKIKILFLSANPSDQNRLNLDKEIREINDKIRAAEYRDDLDLISCWAVRPDDLLQSLNEHKPQIVHFSGHGSTSDELFLLDESGKSMPVAKSALTFLFQTLKDNLRVVVLNACFSKGQAESISKAIDFTVGMGDEISDEAAIVFAASFYRAIGFGRSVQEAFDQGKTALMLAGILEEQTPQLLFRAGVDPSEVHLIHPR